jgi:MFS family permease
MSIHNGRFQVTDLSRQAPRYRWVIVAAVAAMLALSMGLLVNGLSVFFLPLEQEYGWSRSAVALINAVGLIGLAMGGIVMGYAADRISIRMISLIGAVVLAVCVLAASQAETLWQFYVLFFIAGAVGGGSIFAPLMALVGNWFRTGAGLAIGIAAAGQAIGQGGVPFGAAFLIESYGWRGAFLGLGAICLVTLVPLALLTRDPPGRVVGAAAGTAASSSDNPTHLPNGVVLAWLSAAVLMCCTCMAVPLMHLVPLIQGQGISATDAGSVLFLMLIVAIGGRIFFGALADRIGAPTAWLIATAWMTLLVFGFTWISSLGGFYLFAVIYGFGYAGVMTGVLTTTRSLTPASRRASSTGIVLAFAWLGHGLGGYQGGLFYDLTGAYAVTYGNAALAGLLNLALVGGLLLTLPNRRTPALHARQAQESAVHK